VAKRGRQRSSADRKPRCEPVRFAQRVERFGLFADTSDFRFAGRCVSLNVRAVK